MEIYPGDLEFSNSSSNGSSRKNNSSSQKKIIVNACRGASTSGSRSKIVVETCNDLECSNSSSNGSSNCEMLLLKARTRTGPSTSGSRSTISSSSRRSFKKCTSSSHKKIIVKPSSGATSDLGSTDEDDNFPRSSLKRSRRHSSGCLDDKDPESGLEGPSAKRQHLVPSCLPSSSESSSSVPSSVYPSPVDELVNEIDTRSSDSGAPVYSIPIPDSPNSIDDASGLEIPSLSSFETVSTSSVHSDSDSPNKTLIEPSSPRPKIKSFDDYVAAYDCMTPVEPTEPRMCPLPALKWANAYEVWGLMCRKDEQAALYRNARMLEQHPGLQPRMRAILLDWLIEVCEVYKLHRETYYLAWDYLDRYLSSNEKVQKTHLQLIGITCLFIAAKVEEIYPPKIAEFAYVTDGACREEDILQHEIVLLQALGWSISPVTAMGWLGIYMQLRISNRSPASLPGGSQYESSNDDDDTFIYPQFSGLEFVQTAQLLDLCSLDVGIGNFSYAIIAAAAISHTFNKETALQVSGYDWSAIQDCARWMEPFFRVIVEESEHLHLIEQSEQIPSYCGMTHCCPNIVTDDSHIIQTHTISMGMFDRACLMREHSNIMEKTRKPEASPATGLKCPEGLLTPPASSRKPLDDDNEEGDDHTTQITSSQKENIDNSVHNKTTQRT